MRILPRLISAAALAALPAAALADGSAGDSSPAYSFLDITSSSRIFGLGGVNVSAVDPGLAAIDQNPAFLGPEYSKAVSVGYMRYLSDSDFASAAFGNGIGERSAWGVALKYFGYGSMERTDVEGVSSGTFSPKDIAVSATYSRDITDLLRGGATLRWVYSSYDSFTAMAVGVDLGVNYYDPDRDLSLSAVVTNLGGQVKRFRERYDRLPVDVRLGWTQSFPGLPVRFSVTAWNLTKWHLPYYETGDVWQQSDASSGIRSRDSARQPISCRHRLQLQDAHRHGHLFAQRAERLLCRRGHVAGRLRCRCGLRHASSRRINPYAELFGRHRPFSMNQRHN